MTLGQFHTLTVKVSPLMLRQAMAVALSMEVPHTPAAYARFYCRVIAKVGLALGRGCEPAEQSVAA